MSQPPNTSQMAKRSREDESIPAPRLSALAQRRLRSEVNQPSQVEPTPPVSASPTPPAPAPSKIRKTQSAAQRRHVESLAAPAALVSANDEIARKRAEIERRLAERVHVVEALESDPLGPASEDWAAAPGSSSSPTAPIEAAKAPLPRQSEESALARIKREREEKRLAGDEDVEMRSGSDHDDTMDSGAESAAPKLTQISSFVPTEENFTSTDSAVTFRLQPGETLVLVGIYRINVTKGTISISGAILSESTPTQTVYAPMTHALPVIEAPSSKRKRTASEKPTGAEIRITSHHSGLLDIGKLCPTFNTIWRGPSKNTTAHTFAPIFTSFSNIPTITVHKAWKPTLTALTEKANSFEGRPPTIVLAGSKSTGKSTLTRILANRLLTSSSDLTSIAYLDLDPGQPEFSPPGTISLTHLHTPLLGPSFTHALTPTRIHHTGYTTPKDDPGHYIRSTLDLLLTHRQTNPTTPLLINTTGWTKGLGLELLHDILTHSRATDIIFLGHLAQNPLSDPTPAGQATLYTLPPAAPTIPARFSPADLRSLQTMSHFHRLAGDWDFSRPLTGIAPWVVPYTAPSQGIDAVHILGEHIPADELRTAIEGTIVAVVLVSKHNLPEAFSSSPTVLSSGTVLPAVLDTSLGPEISSCAGLAVLRCIDAAQQTVQLVTAIPDEAVAAWEREGKRVVLVRGRLELSGWEMAVAGGAAGGEMPWVSSGEGKKAAGAVWRVRRNVMRRGQQ